MARSVISRENDTRRDQEDSFNRAVSTREMSVEEHIRGSKQQNPLQSSVELNSSKNLGFKAEQVTDTSDTGINTILEMRHITMLLERSKEL